MPYPQLSPILDFSIVDTHNPVTLGVADISFYPSNFTVINPTMEITPPGFTKATIIYTVSTINIVNGNILNISCVNDASLLPNLPDGIWKIKMTISPPISFNVERTFIRTTLLEQKFGKALLKTDITQCNQDIKNEQMKVLDLAYFYIYASIAAANQCNNKLAMDLYRTANKMLDNFLQDRCNQLQHLLW